MYLFNFVESEAVNCRETAAFDCGCTAWLSTRYGMEMELLYLMFISYMAFKVICLFLFLAVPGLHCQRRQVRAFSSRR